MKFFEVCFHVHARETTPGADKTQCRDVSTPLLVTVYMGNDATPEDAVRALAEKLEAMCNDAPPDSGG